jgi:transcriptional regulator with XRE-family HTH domain
MSQSQDLAENQRRLLREFLNNQKLTQQEVADALGIRQTNVSALLRGERNFGRKMAERWSKAFGIRVNWLLTGEGAMFNTDIAEPTSDIPTPPAPSELDELIPIVPNGVTNMNNAPKVHQFPRYDFYFQCVTDAMRPEIYAGDLLGIRRLEPGAPLINGETYVFDTKSAGMQIRMLEEKEDGYLATAHNDRYKDTFFPRSEVLCIFTIVGLVRVK